MKYFVAVIISFITVCTAHAQVQQADSLYFFVRYQHSVLFDTDKANVDSLKISVLSIMKRLAAKHPDDQILLEGRADWRGTDKYNERLAKRRVDSVKAALIIEGFKDSIFTENIYGEQNPIALNRTPEAMQANRSVRILLGQYAPAEWIEGQITDSLGIGVQATIFMGNKYQMREFDTDSDGYFTVPVPKDGIISLEAFSCNHILRKRYINLAKSGSNLNRLIVENIRVGMSFDFDDILFLGDRDIVLPEYIPYLDVLVRRVKKASCVKFEIQGHINLPNTPPQDTTTWHYDLSLRRAQRIYNYLVDHGIDPNRLTYKGYSNWHMRYPNARTEEKQRLNRRVTLLVTEFMFDQ